MYSYFKIITIISTTPSKSTTKTVTTWPPCHRQRRSKFEMLRLFLEYRVLARNWERSVIALINRVPLVFMNYDFHMRCMIKSYKVYFWLNPPLC